MLPLIVTYPDWVSVPIHIPPVVPVCPLTTNLPEPDVFNQRFAPGFKLWIWKLPSSNNCPPFVLKFIALPVALKPIVLPAALGIWTIPASVNDHITFAYPLSTISKVPSWFNLNDLFGFETGFVELETLIKSIYVEPPTVFDPETYIALSVPDGGTIFKFWVNVFK